MNDLKKSAAVVAGATDAVCKAICSELAENGNAVIICDGDEAEVERLVAQLKKEGKHVRGWVVDTSGADSVRKTVEEIITQYSNIDILVNCIDHPGGERIASVTDDCWSRALDANLNSAFYFCREIAPIMRENGFGRIINVSGMDYLGWSGKVDIAASKAAAFGLTRALALEMAKDNVMVNCIVQGDIETPAMQADDVKQRSDALPVRRAGQPEDVARAVSFFASRSCKYITGQMFFVCGGKSLYASMSV